ncbi:MAG: hypothetical protein F6K41_40355, partial [Symploca sp. SIO3E6]|nr:hypothetical protein [Caldora sp. SIO3E6]
MNSLVGQKQGFWVKLTEYCQKNYDCLTRDFRLFLMRKIARIEVVRNLIVALSRSRKNCHELTKSSHSMFPDVNIDEAASSLKNNG